MLKRRSMSFLAAVFALAVFLPATNGEATSQAQERATENFNLFTSHKDLAYVSNGHERQRLDLYIPSHGQNPTHRLPLIIWIHGGGWQNGSKENCPPLRFGFPAKGFAVASIGYRLSSDAVFPAQIEDCKAAIRWLRAHASEYGIDPERFGAWGSSAGGHLVALVGASGDVKQFDVGEHLEFSSRVQAVCDYFGPTDFSQMDAHAIPGARLKHDSENSPEAKLIGGPVQQNPDKVAAVNPITYVSEDDPAFLIVHGDKDPLVPIHQSQLLFDALKMNGIEVQFHTIHDAEHGGRGFNSATVTQVVDSFFTRHLTAIDRPGNKGLATTTESSADDDATAATRRQKNVSQLMQPSFSAILIREDADHDGKISLQEFKGPKPLFQRWDNNGDGFVTRDEHKAATGRP